MYAVANCIHLLLFGENMRLNYTYLENYSQNLTQDLRFPLHSFKRYWDQLFWKNIFVSLLNPKIQLNEHINYFGLINNLISLATIKIESYETSEFKVKYRYLLKFK